MGIDVARVQPLTASRHVLEFLLLNTFAKRISLGQDMLYKLDMSVIWHQWC